MSARHYSPASRSQRTRRLWMVGQLLGNYPLRRRRSLVQEAGFSEIAPLPNFVSSTPPVYIEKGFTQFSLRASSTLL